MKLKVRIFTMILYVSISSYSQDLKIIKFDDLEQKILESKQDRISIYNFWATWCKPCIIEMPYFENMAIKYKSKIDLIFISLDFADLAESRVIPFLKNKKINSRTLLLDDTNYYTWIDKIDPTWSGAIPATLIVDFNGNKHFYEKQFEEKELESILTKFMIQPTKK